MSELVKQEAFEKKELYELVDSFVVGNHCNAEGEPDREANLKGWIDSLDESSNDYLLAVGALIVQRIRQDIFNTLGFRCSAGIAHNKVRKETF